MQLCLYGRMHNVNDEEIVAKRCNCVKGKLLHCTCLGIKHEACQS